MHPLRNAEIVKQGKTVIEAGDGDFLVMHPDGEVVLAGTREQAERKARRWYKKHLGDDGLRVGVGEIEWRL